MLSVAYLGYVCSRSLARLCLLQSSTCLAALRIVCCPAAAAPNSVACVCGAHLDLSTLLQERKAAVIRAEGESESARLISDATRVAGPGLIELRRIEAAKDVASTLARSGNVVYLPNQNNMLLGVNPGMAGGR